MTLAEDFWLRGKAAQSSLMQLWAYNTAFAGTATIQAWKMGLSAPTGFWQAMGRVGASNAPSARCRADAQAEEGRRRRKAPATPRAVADCEVAAHPPSPKPRSPRQSPWRFRRPHLHLRRSPRFSAPARIFWTRRAAARPMT
jgi:hypothetical protein